MTIKDNPRGRMLLDAHRCVNADRNVSYGDPNADFARTAAYFNTHLVGVLTRKMHEAGLTLALVGPDIRHILDNLVDTWDVAIMQEFVKLSRLAWSPGKADSWVDTAGYAACGYDCVVAAGLADANDLPYTDEHPVDPAPLGGIISWPAELDPVAVAAAWHAAKRPEPQPVDANGAPIPTPDLRPILRGDAVSDDIVVEPQQSEEWPDFVGDTELPREKFDNGHA